MMFIIKVEKEHNHVQYIYHVEDNVYGFTPLKEKALQFKTEQKAFDFVVSMPRKYKEITKVEGV